MNDYGKRGLIGVLTPQANTTVEPEFWSLLPTGWSFINARLTSRKNTIESRLIDYTKCFEQVAEEFGNAPLNLIASACTGVSYLIGAEAELKIKLKMEEKYNIPFVTAALATVEALNDLNAKKISLLSPYPKSLTKASIDYWQGHGFEVVSMSGPKLEVNEFHPIYAMAGSGVLQAYRELSDSSSDVVVMMGTGMSTLSSLYLGQSENLKTAFSCNSALVWNCCLKHAPSETPTMEAWITSKNWKKKYDLLVGPHGNINS
jgi:maleate cis-trans isomerase